MLKASSAGPQFVGDDAQLAEIEREQVVARRVAVAEYLRGEYISPESRRLVREALEISNDEAAHLGLSDYGAETAQDAYAWAVGFEEINAERRTQYDLDKAEYKQARARYDQYLRDKAAYDQYLIDRAEHDGTTPEAPPDDGVDPFNPREFEAKTKPEVFAPLSRLTKG